MYWTNRSVSEKKFTDKKASIAVVGLGYVGLPIAMTFAKKGFRVYGYDIDGTKVECLNKKMNYLASEKWIEPILKKARRFSASPDVENAGCHDVIIIAVPTPADPITKKPIYDYVISVANSVGSGLKKGALVILESTVGPGTTEGIFRKTLEDVSGLKAGDDFGLAYSPERVNPGDDKHRIENIPKVVSGIDELSADLCARLYMQIVPTVYKTSTMMEAELTKLFENIQRDMNVALANEFAKICDVLGADVTNVIEAASTKWNFYNVSPGCGVGGHCLPDDPWFLIHELEKRGYTSDLIKTARKTNDGMPAYTVGKAENLLFKKANGSKIAIVGLAYKEDVPDIRNSPAKAIVENMKSKGYTNIVAYDPYISNVDWIKTDSFENAVKDAELVIVTTPHRRINLSAKHIRKLAPNASVVDGRNVLNKNEFIAQNIRYSGIGR